MNDGKNSGHKVEKLVRNVELETFFDLATNLGHDWALDKFRPNISALADSRDRLELCIKWANEFNEFHKSTDWQEVDYLETIDGFYTEKVKDWYAGASNEHN